MEIYVITIGEYSDYHIITATTDLALAEKIKEKYSNEYYTAEIEVYEDAETMLKPVYEVYFDKKGNVEKTIVCETGYIQYYELNRFTKRIDLSGYIYVAADTAEAAIKIAAEKRAKYLAEKEGL